MLHDLKKLKGELLELIGLAANSAQLGINTFFAVNPNPIAPGQSAFFDAAPYTPKTSGSALVLAAMQTQTSNAGDGASIQIRHNGVLTGVPLQQASPTVDISATPWEVIVITAGVPVTMGVEATNTTGGHTCAALAGHAAVFIIELQTS